MRSIDEEIAHHLQQAAQSGELSRAKGYGKPELDDDGWNSPAWMVRGPQEFLLRNTVGGLLWLALFDAVHHRGQAHAMLSSTRVKPRSWRKPAAKAW